MCGKRIRRLCIETLLCFWAGFLPFALHLYPQAPDASLSGLVVNSQGQPLAGVVLTITNANTGFSQTASSDSRGRYFFASLPRGLYNLRAGLPGYQPLEKQAIQLEVGARREENVLLSSVAEKDEKDEPARSSDIFQLVPPPPSLAAETTASSISVVVDESRLLQLPLSSRNVYSLFLLQPGVTSQGAVGARGLTFSVHGQRVSGSNYQLDGTDNNNIVLTGPVLSSSVEAVQEFRMINSSFSAENGRATAFVAHAITRSGTNYLHGSMFEFLGDDLLNANTVANKSNGIAKSPLRQNQFGYSLGGPLQRNRTFFWSEAQLSRLQYGTPETLQVPSQLFIANLPADSVAKQLLNQIPPYPSAPSPSDPNIGELHFQAPNRINNIELNQRLDQISAATADRLTFRYSGSWSAQRLSSVYGTPGIGYPALIPNDHFGAHNLLFRWMHSFTPGRGNDLRIGWSRERVDLPRPQAAVPMLQSLDGVLLPASARQFRQSENNNVVQLSERFSILKGRSNWTAGLDWRWNFSKGQSLGLQNEALGGFARIPAGLYVFDSLESFGQDRPSAFSAGVDPLSPQRPQTPALQRSYRSRELAAFVQNEAKLSRNWSVNLGLRYEYYGPLHSTDPSKDVNFYFGQGATLDERLANGTMRSSAQNPGNLKNRLYRPDRFNLAPSAGIAWDPLGTGRSVVRAGYSVAFDRILDTIRDLRSNNLQVESCLMFAGCNPAFLLPLQAALQNFSNDNAVFTPYSIVQIDEQLRTPYVQNWYVGLQHALSPTLMLEIAHAGSAGRKLLSRDTINRLRPDLTAPNPAIGEDTFISNQASSGYRALQISLHRPFRRGLQYQVSYTFSHAIDNQSDIFQGVRTDPRTGQFAIATFTRQLDPDFDRGNADFDQRHNLVLNLIWDLPAPPAGPQWIRRIGKYWTLSLIGAHRSGFPVTVIADSFLSDPATGLLNNRLDFLGQPGQPYRSSHPAPVPGGVQWLDPSLFAPAIGHPGNTGRGAIPGPGFWNYDLALLRDVAISELKQVQFRLELYNAFNHANLSAPVTTYLSDPITGRPNPDFGKAFYGLNNSHSRFGDLPLQSSARTIQLGIRFRF